MKRIAKLDTNNHSVYSLNYHLVIVTKYRCPVLTDDMAITLREIFNKISPDYQVTLIELGHEADHVHYLFKAQPTTDLVKFINSYKSATARILRKDYPILKQELRHGALWSHSYCLITTGGAPLDAIKEYVASQGGKR